MSVPPTAIDRVRAREILDSRGNPTVEVDVALAGGASGRAAVPSGASTGAAEAVELRDGDERYGGKGVRDAVANVTDRLAPEVLGRDALDQRGLDDAIRLCDGTPNLASVGANAALGLSLAAAAACAVHLDLPEFRYLGGAGACVLPVPFFNVLNGGAHADNDVDVQEFMVAPIGAPSFREALRSGAEVYAALRRLAADMGLDTNLGDEGGIAPEIGSTREALDLVCDAVEAAGFRPGTDVAVALDVAASELGSGGEYRLEGRVLDAAGMADVCEALCRDYPIVSLEDPLGEDDWDGWRLLTERLGSRVQLVGDDLLVTDPERVRRAADEGSGNAVLVKPNQVGTLTGTLDTVAEARRRGWGAMLSHRSGETTDVAIAHLAVATGTGQIKAGAPARGERTAKYNELLRIEEALDSGARYAGWDPARRW